MASTVVSPHVRRFAPLAVLLALLALMLPTVGGSEPIPASAAAAPRSVTVTPDTGIRGWDKVTVRWAGFPANAPVTISQYGSSGVTARWNRLPVYTNADGTGQATFTVGLGNTCFGPNSTACRIVVSDCASYAADGSWGYTFFTEPTGPGWASAPIQIIEPPEEDPDTGDLLNRATLAPPPPVQPPEEPGELPTITRAVPSAVTGSPQSALVDAWRNDVLYGGGADPFNLDITPINSPTAIEELVGGSVDFAVTGMTPTAEQLQALEAAGRPVVAVPVAADGLVIVQDRRSGAISETTGFDLRTISVNTVASLFNLSGTNDVNEALTAENRGCDVSSSSLTDSRFTRFIYRADRSATNLLLLSWLNERGASDRAPSTVIELGQGSFTGINGGDEVVARFMTRTFEGAGGDEFARRIGYVSRSTAVRDRLATFDLALPSGGQVRPTPETIAAALSGRALDPVEGVDLDLATTEAGKWPLAYVNYVLVPTYPSGTLSADELAVVQDFLEHALSTDGQARAAELGYTPLPAALLTEARALTATIKLEAPSAPTTSTTTTPSATFPTFGAGFGDDGFFGDSLNSPVDDGTDGGGDDDASSDTHEIVPASQGRPFLLGGGGLVPSLGLIFVVGTAAVVFGCFPSARARAKRVIDTVRRRLA